jgi:tetratricopeptide (TPR) repeat protein
MKEGYYQKTNETMKSKQFTSLIFFMLLIGFTNNLVAQNIPEEARRHFQYGIAAAEMANTPADYQEAVKEFKQAATLAPNWADVYYQLGLTLEKIQNYNEAIIYYKKYLQLNPDSEKSGAVKDLIYKLEYKAGKENDKKAIMDALQSGVKERRGFGFSFLAGIVFKPSGTGIVLDVYRGDYPEYNQLNIPVEFDGKNLKMSYFVYRCPSAGMSNFVHYPCEEKHTFSGNVISTNPLILDVTIKVKQSSGNFSPTEYKGQWIFNK